VHPIGIYSDDISLGGKAHTIVPTSPWLIRNIFLEMSNLKQDYPGLAEFEVSVEQSHHGPFLEKPVLFVEIGSTEAEWTNKDAGELIAKAVFNALLRFNPTEIDKTCACILGGGHYNQIANKILLRTEYSMGHICSKYALEHLNEDMIKQMKEKTDPDNPILFIFDWKSCGKEKQRIVDILDKLGYEWKKSKEILKTEE
jgi:D-aminoacyl-tRNA deacylase